MNNDSLHGGSNRLRLLLLLFAICTLVGLFNSSTFIAQYRTESDQEPIRKILLNEMTAAYTIFLLLPGLLLFMERVPVRRNNWYRSVPLHLVVSIAFGASHTTLMTLTRTWLYPVAALGSYDPGQLLFRYLMEYHKQLLIYILIAATVCMTKQMRDARAREREAAELTLRASKLQAQLSEARLQALQGRLQPHFLFNTLNMISSLMYEDVPKADRMMARLSTLLRMSLDSAESRCVPLSREMEILEAYLDIMEARFGQRLRVTREMDPEVTAALVPTLILQPLVENAIRHGEPEPNRPVEISVRAVRRGNRLRLEVADRGPGLAPVSPGSEGVGLRSVRDRLTELYGSEAGLNLENLSPRGLRVIIELPLGPLAGKPPGAAVNDAANAYTLEAVP